MLARLLILIASLLLCTESDSQVGRLTFRHITRRTGLPVDKVTSLAQDSSGFIWIGSEEGLFRYDGFTFKAFFSEPGNAQTLAENIITKILVSSKGLLWVASVGGGIACMKNDGKVLKTFNSRTTSSFSPAADYVSDIKEDKNGNIWWSSVDGLFRYQPGAREPQCYKIQPTVSRANHLNSICIDRSGKIWTAGFVGFKIFDPAHSSFTEITDPLLRDAKKDVASFIFHSNQLWFSSWAPDLGFYNFSNKNFSLLYSGAGTLQPDFEKMCNQFYVDRKENLWVATGRGLFFVRKDEVNVAQSFLFEPGNIYSIMDSDVTSILEDREGNFWFGTRHGISLTQPYGQKILNLSTNNLKEAAFGDKNVNKIIEVDANTFLIATHYADGIYETDSNFRTRKHFSFNDVRYDWIWTCYDDKLRNRLFISTQERMLEYHKITHKLKKRTDSLFNISNPVSAFAPVSDSIVWMSRFRNSFFRYNIVTGSFKEYKLETLGLPPQVLYLSKDRDNHLWLIAHNSGLFCFDEKKEKIVDQLTVNNSSQSLQQTNIMFFRDIGDYFLIGYSTKGISLYNKKKHRYEHFSQSDGLVSNNTRDVLFINDKAVWIATTNGLSLFNIADRSFKNYSYENGILSNDFICITQLSSGKIAAGTTKGMIVFNPVQVDQSPSLPVPIITEINVYGKKIPVEELGHKPLEISYRKNYFSIDYLSLQYNNNSQIEYAYKLEGLDKDWVNAGKRRFASYSNIKGGHYQFRVRARRPGEPWVETSAPLPIIIYPPFYTQWWFYALCISILAILIYVLFRYRVQQLLKLEKMRTVISGDLHDEVGASLTSISIFSEMARKSVAPASREEQYLKRIGDRSRESIEKMSDIIWSINPDNDSLQQMLVRMKNYATEISEASEVAIHWTESGNLAASKLSMERRKNIYLLFKEVMNNSIKHAASQNIFVHLSSFSNHIKMKIADDGKGFDKHQVNYGNGIKSIERRAAALKGSVTLQSSPGQGTSVLVEFHF